MRKRLEEKRQEILESYKRDLRVGQESNDEPTEDIVDRANNAYHRELMFSLSDSERQLLLQIEAALSRFELGTFGACVHCGDPIALPRLQAIPWARLCINCQELAEKGLLDDN
jgi:DnaK suppressor protein